MFVDQLLTSADHLRSYSILAILQYLLRVHVQKTCCYPAVLTGLGITYKNLHNSIVLQGLCPLIEGILWLLTFLLPL